MKKQTSALRSRVACAKATSFPRSSVASVSLCLAGSPSSSLWYFVGLLAFPLWALPSPFVYFLMSFASILGFPLPTSLRCVFFFLVLSFLNRVGEGEGEGLNNRSGVKEKKGTKSCGPVPKSGVLLGNIGERASF